MRASQGVEIGVINTRHANETYPQATVLQANVNLATEVALVRVNVPESVPKNAAVPSLAVSQQEITSQLLQVSCTSRKFYSLTVGVSLSQMNSRPSYSKPHSDSVSLVGSYVM